MKYEDEDVNLRDLIDHFVSVFKGETGAKGVSLVSQLSDDIPEVRGDKGRLSQVLSNLLSNAVKFTPQGGEIKLKCDLADSMLEVRVEDTGPGIDAKEHKLIFSRFGQSENKETKEKGGTGLGLAIVKEIVEHHGGEIWVESEVGVGSKFVFTLPV